MLLGGGWEVRAHRAHKAHMLLGGGWEVRACRACRAHRAHMLLGSGWEVRAHRARKAHMLLGGGWEVRNKNRNNNKWNKMEDTHTAVVLGLFAACSELTVGLFAAWSNFVNINFS